jgi:phenylacetate-coenzyme A ligase PaaK-like adenylate-forming protein
LKKKIAEVLAEMGSDRAVVSGTYGFTEARMAFSECPTGHEHSSGYHTYPDLCVFEVVDPETGEPVEEGAKGELVYTPLDGRGTTVLRYRTGDLAIGGVSTEPCPWCGRTVPRIHSDLRRVSDQRALELTKIRGTLVDLSAMGAILSGIAEVVEWQVAIAKLRDDPLELDVFTVRVSLKPGADANLAKEKIRRELHDALEVTPNAVEVLDDARMLELLGMETELKEKRFLDLRPKA